MPGERDDDLAAFGERDLGVRPSAVVLGGFHLAYLIGAALIGVATVLAVSVLPRPPRTQEAAEHHGARPHAEVAFAEGG